MAVRLAFPAFPTRSQAVVPSYPSSEAVNLLNDHVFGCRKSLFLVDRSTIEEGLTSPRWTGPRRLVPPSTRILRPNKFTLSLLPVFARSAGSRAAFPTRP